MIELNHPDIENYLRSFLSDIKIFDNFHVRDANDAKIRSILNSDVYTKATRLIEASVKNIIFNCHIVRGDTVEELDSLRMRLKSLNNPNFNNIRSLILNEIGIDITNGISEGKILGKDITLLNEIVKNRHKNVHASEEPNTWYSSNRLDLEKFKKQFEGVQNILFYLDSIKYSLEEAAFYIE